MNGACGPSDRGSGVTPSHDQAIHSIQPSDTSLCTTIMSRELRGWTSCTAEPPQQNGPNIRSDMNKSNRHEVQARDFAQPITSASSNIQAPQVPAPEVPTLQVPGPKVPTPHVPAPKAPARDYLTRLPAPIQRIIYSFLPLPTLQVLQATHPHFREFIGLKKQEYKLIYWQNSNLDHPRTILPKEPFISQLHQAATSDSFLSTRDVKPCSCRLQLRHRTSFDRLQWQMDQLCFCIPCGH